MLDLNLPVFEVWLEGNEVRDYLNIYFSISIGMGVLAGILIILFSFLFTSVSTVFLIAEIVWIFYKIKKTSDGKPTTIGIWLAIFISAIIFGLGYLPITGTITTITPLIVARAVILKELVE
jgi:hypothetical protein